MRRIILKITSGRALWRGYDVVLLGYRLLLSLEMIFAHGLKKIGLGVSEAEVVPNPLNLPEELNGLLAISANLFFPVLIIFGFFTRLAVLPILSVTLTGYFVLHFHDAPLLKDTPFIYSLSYLLILFLGAGKYSIDYFIHKKYL